MASSNASSAPITVRFMIQDPGSRQTGQDKTIKIAQARSHAAKYVGRRARWERQMSFRREMECESSQRHEQEKRTADDGANDGTEDQTPESSKVVVHNALTQSKRDPFSPYDASEHPAVFQDLIEYTYDKLWPDLIEVQGKPAVHPGRRQWRLAAQECSAVHHVHLASVADFGKAMYSAYGYSAMFDRLRLFHHTKALRLVRQIIQNMEPNDIPTDSLVMAVYNLSYQGLDWDKRVFPESHPPSPTLGARFLIRYGRKVPHAEHIRAMNLLIQAKGGLEEIELIGIAEMIWLWSLNNCTTLIQPPSFPLLKSYEKLLTEYTERVKISLRNGTFGRLGTGFLVLPARDAIGRLRERLLVTAAITVDLCHLEPGYERTREWRRLLAVARANHHQILDMPTEIPVSEAGSEEERLIFAITRLGALLYDDMVVYPQIDSSEIKPRLAHALRRALTEKFHKFTPGGGREEYRPLVLWTLLLGCIGATYTPHDRPWFVSQLHERSAQLGLNKFQDFKAAMGCYLWFENLDGPARKAWSEGENAFRTKHTEQDEDEVEDKHTPKDKDKDSKSQGDF
ncbi:uncharacterized protein Z520_00871 [Fonsecaea multimorphosa CBS 102226]|uniref:Uncharacterized protein n=1 Tax=Fonsecaea multimorphosa CBS 102226 TaxID=1442371 RepID=A0A0D2L519_9EURO|nr:uncharacterized protein Z520_00871 [Fonsecaea multimorphosa CBS 102226]KIY04179.1 hypothetical protein Z520_00871 [Fonsecaea multimorphosa CBS 102226]OAL32008.1 hypothetical protein AYO22_00878 [Fonsecaea multimorphosa]